MKNDSRKLELMLDCYLGKWHPLEGDQKQQFNDWGIGNKRLTLAVNIMLYNKTFDETFKQKTWNIYNSVLDRYKQIPFRKLDKFDPDFKPVFSGFYYFLKLEQNLKNYFNEPNQDNYTLVTEQLSLFAAVDKNPSFAERVKNLSEKVSNDSS